MKKSAFLAAMTLIAVFFSARPALGLSPTAGFALVRKVPPGEELSSAAKFLGAHTFETLIDPEKQIQLRRWGEESDNWSFEALHDGKEIKATRVIWKTRSVGEQQTIFAQLSSAGKKIYGKRGEFTASNEVRWSEFSGRWLIVARYGPSVTEGASLLSGIRSKEFDSATYGF